MASPSCLLLHVPPSEHLGRAGSQGSIREGRRHDRLCEDCTLQLVRDPKAGEGNQEGDLQGQKLVAAVLRYAWKDIKNEFQEVDELLSYDEVVADDSDVREELKEYAEFKGDKTVLSKYDKTCSSSEKGKLARNSESVVVQKVGSKRSAQSKARKVCYPTAEAFLVKTLRERWQQGDPISRMELRDELATVFTEDTSGDSLAFYKQMIDLEKANQCSNLSRWMSMAFSRMVPPYSEREKTVSQSVPTNWYEIAINSCGPGGSIFETFDEAFDGHGPDVLVAADQSFFLFHHEAKRVMVPMGSKRVGGNVKADAKVRYSHVCLCVCMSNKHRLIFSFGRPDAP